MSKDNDFRTTGEPLSVGNVVSAGLRIYRDRFKPYYLEALRSYLWVLVPVYGWAKCLAIQGLLSRLAFYEVLEQPESIPEARLRVKPRLWSFLLTGLLIGLMVLGGGIITVLVMGMIILFAGFSGQRGSPLAIVFVLLFIVLIFFFLFGYIWFYSRVALADLAIAIESVTDPVQAIKRSWQLTQGYVVRLQIIFFVAILITLPTAIIGNLGTLFLGDESPLASLIDLILTVALGALLIPFWQAIKAVIYYDLKSRKEGLGLSLTDEV